MPPRPKRLTQIEGGLPVEYSSPKTAAWLRRLSFPEDEMPFDLDEDLVANSPLRYSDGNQQVTPNPADTSAAVGDYRNNLNVAGTSATVTSSALSGGTASEPQTPTVGPYNRALHMSMNGNQVPDGDGGLPSAKDIPVDGSSPPVPASSFSLGTAVHMAAVALRPKALVATGIPYPHFDTWGVQTQFLSKQFSQDTFAAILELSQPLGADSLPKFAIHEDQEMMEQGPTKAIMVETRLASATSGDERSVACRSVARLQGKRTQAPSNTFSYSFQDHAWIWLPKTVGDRATAAQAVRDESDVTEGRIAAEKMLIDVYEEDSVTSGLPVLSGAIELPEGWLFSEVFDLEVELRPPDGSPCRSLDKQSMSLQVKVHPVCDIPRGAMRAARQASMRASEEQAEMDAVKAMALTGDLAKSPVRTGSIGRSLSRSRSRLRSRSEVRSSGPPMEAIQPGKMKPAWQEAVRTWELFANVFPGEFLCGSESVAWLQHAASHTKVLIEWNKSLREVVVAFQTTTSRERYYLDEDSAKCTCCVPAFPIPMSPRTFRNRRKKSSARLSTGAVSVDSDASGADRGPTAPWEVDQEIFAAWMAVQSSVSSVVRECVRTEPEKQWTVLCVGHSTGGALATIAAQALSTAQPHVPSKIVCYTFGAPKVGEQEFVRSFNSHVECSWRVTVAGDSRLQGTATDKSTYWHVRGSVQLAECERGGKMKLPEDAGDVKLLWTRLHEPFPKEVANLVLGDGDQKQSEKNPRNVTQRRGFVNKMRSTCSRKVVTGADLADLVATRMYLESMLATSSALVTPGQTQDMLVRVRRALEEGVW